MDENLDKKDILKVWRDCFLIEDALVAIEKTESYGTPDKFSSLLEKTVSRYCAWHHRIYNRANQGNHERVCQYGKKGEPVCESFQDMDLG